MAAFAKKNPNIKIELETRPQGGEGDNLVKTRLATQEMADIFSYNSGSLFQALRPETSMQPLTDEPWVKDLDPAFKPAVTANDQVYGAPIGFSSEGGGVLYNKKIYERLNLEIPKTWDEFMANNAKIKAEGIDPVLQSYQDTWTSQLFVLGDFHNVAAAGPAVGRQVHEEPGQVRAGAGGRGLQAPGGGQQGRLPERELRLAEVREGAEPARAGQGRALPDPDLDAAEHRDVRPGQGRGHRLLRRSPATTPRSAGATLWLPGATYIPRTTEGEKLDAAKKFLAFIASPEGCDVYAKAWDVAGPFMVKGCELPADVPPAIQDVTEVRRRREGHAGARVRVAGQGAGARADHGRGRLRASARPRTAPSSTTRTSRSRPSSSGSRAGRRLHGNRVPAARLARAAGTALPQTRDTGDLRCPSKHATKRSPRRPPPHARKRRRGEEPVSVLVLPAGLHRLLRLLPLSDDHVVLLQLHALDAVRRGVDRAGELQAVLLRAGAHQGPHQHADLRRGHLGPQGRAGHAARRAAHLERDRQGVHAVRRLLPRPGEHDRRRADLRRAHGAR